jgi:sugar phosphate isomerase/epimerase
MRRFAVSSWSLDGSLTGGLPLLDLPAQLAEHAVPVLELCHFHLPSNAPEYLARLRAALANAGVELYSLLIDAGDITAPDPARRTADVAFIQGQIAVAAALGARQVRIDAGLQPPTPQAVERSAAGLRGLARYAAERGVGAITENWHATSQDAGALLAILDGCAGAVGLCADTGNAEPTPDKYATLARLLPRASSVHFKPRADAAGAYDEDDIRRCCALIDAAGFDGVVTLIYGGKQGEWAEIERLRDALRPLGAA